MFTVFLNLSNQPAQEEEGEGWDGARAGTGIWSNLQNASADRGSHLLCDSGLPRRESHEKSLRFGGRSLSAWVPALPIPLWGAFGEILHLYEPQFSHLEKGADHHIYFIVLLRKFQRGERV